MEICAIVSLARQFSYKRGNLSGLNSGREVSPKPFLDCGVQGCRIISVKKTWVRKTGCVTENLTSACASDMRKNKVLDMIHFF